MFDWNDEELVNILWGEAAESDDHIVPYPHGREERPSDLFGDHIKKEWNDEAAKVKPIELKKPLARTELNWGKLEKNSQSDRNEGLVIARHGMGSWTDLSLSNATKPDQDIDEPPKVVGGSQIFQNQNEEKENCDFVDYGWDNIGSFDDLDRIFSNGDPVFGRASLENADEPWSSSKAISSSPDQSVSMLMDFSTPGSRVLTNTSEHFRKEEYKLDQDQTFTPGNEKVNDITSHVPPIVPRNITHLEHAGRNSNLSVKDKILRNSADLVSKTRLFNPNIDTRNVATPTRFAEKMSRKTELLKSRKRSEEECEAGQIQDLFSSWPSSGNQVLQHKSQCTQIGDTSTSLRINQQMQLQGQESQQDEHFSTTLLDPPLHVDIQNNDIVNPVLPCFHPGVNNQKVPSAFGVSSGDSYTFDKFPGSPAKPLAMTPQEKIEKLRRHQQMQAMLAIQKQQRQFGHIQFVGGNFDVDDFKNTLPSLDPNSIIQQDDSSTIYTGIDKCSLQDAILYQLQAIVVKMDIQLRLCIRDSLHRLAQSAMQRQYTKDATSTNISSANDLKFLAKEERNSNNRMPQVEAETNPIDRTVAHLLFHRATELSGKYPETPESPASAEVPRESKTSLPISPENFKCKGTQSDLVSKSPVFCEGEKSKSSSIIKTSENASNYDLPPRGAAEDEASY